MLKKSLWFLVDYAPGWLPSVALVVFVARGDWSTARGIGAGMVLVYIGLMIQNMLSRNPDQADSPQQP